MKIKKLIIKILQNMTGYFMWWMTNKNIVCLLCLLRVSGIFTSFATSDAYKIKFFALYKRVYVYKSINVCTEDLLRKNLYHLLVTVTTCVSLSTLHFNYLIWFSSDMNTQTIIIIHFVLILNILSQCMFTNYCPF